MEQKLQAVVLAAGESSRLWPLNSQHKSLLKIMGKPLIWYTIDGLSKVGVKEVVVVQGPDRDAESALKDLPPCVESIKYVIQQEANGQGKATFAAREHIDGQFFVVFGHSVDCREVCEKMLQKSRQTGAKTVLVGQPTSEPWLYGCPRVEGDRLFEVIEKPTPGNEPSKLKVNGVYLLDNKYFGYLEKTLGTTHFNQEFEVALSAYTREHDSRIVVLDKDYKGISLKYPWHLFKVQRYLFDKFLTKKKIAKTALVAKNAVIDGNVIIGENCKIYEGAVIKGPCYIGDNSIVGSNSIVRDCNLESGAMVGALCEMARTIFEPDVHVHSGYLGDSILASGVRVGAGSITANIRIDRGQISARVKKEKDGVKVLSKVDTGLTSLGVIIGRNSKIGTRVTFMPARFIGKDCQVKPTTVVMRNVDDGMTIE
jgi:UDP-N-acetylglucosamine diphosphorylase / glucose-1-phosphate thymidylyltransferase / UDP-N-acetylgalactosamine diphosphorylase / glucosamine-1-phosphate N-acetyltransferase / galactosamine-1-phosphate N-acetyltransferase